MSTKTQVERGSSANGDAECRKQFEAMCQFMRVDFSLEWDNAGFYDQLEADRSYTWFKLGYERAAQQCIALADEQWVRDPRVSGGDAIRAAKSE
jgi:hypothetical protein